MLMKLVPGWRWSIHGGEIQMKSLSTIWKAQYCNPWNFVEWIIEFSIQWGRKKKKTEIDWAIQITSHLFFPEGNIQTCHDLQRNQILDWKTIL